MSGWPWPPNVKQKRNEFRMKLQPNNVNVICFNKKQLWGWHNWKDASLSPDSVNIRVMSTWCFTQQIGRSNGRSGSVLLWFPFVFLSPPAVVPIQFCFLFNNCICIWICAHRAHSFRRWLYGKIAPFVFAPDAKKTASGKNKQSKQKIVYWNMSVFPYTSHCTKS